MCKLAVNDVDLYGGERLRNIRKLFIAPMSGFSTPIYDALPKFLHQRIRNMSDDDRDDTRTAVRR